MRRAGLLLPIAMIVAGCASRAPAPLAIVAPPPPAAAPVITGYDNVVVPPRLADGSFATPNRTVSAAGAIWHLRAGLNVAALACREPDEEATVAAYNALLTAQRAPLAAAYRALGHEYGDIAAFDAAMTRLYSYYALPPARPGLCAAARGVLSDAAQLPPDALPGFALAALTRLDAPFVAIFEAQEAWRTAQAPVAVAQNIAAPRLVVDPSVFALP